MFLWAHNSGLGEARPPIGKVLKIWTEGKGKKAKLMFRPQFDMADEFARDIYRKFKDGFLNAFSVGFKPLEIDPTGEFLVYTKSELLEISAVPVPANQEALVQLKSVGMEVATWKEMGIEKAEEAKDEIPNDTEGETDKDTEEQTTEDADVAEVPEDDTDKTDEPEKIEEEKTEEPEPIEEPTKEEVDQKEMKELQDALKIVYQSVSKALHKIKNIEGVK